MKKYRQLGLLRYSVAGRFGPTLPTSHQGSKPGYRHKLNPARRLQRDFLYGQYAAAGRLGELASGQKCVPPHIKQRKPLAPAHPVSSGERLLAYAVANGHGQHMLAGADHGKALAGLTPAQRRRYGKKLNHAQARGVKDAPVAVEPLRKTSKGTPQPRSGALSRGFRKMLGRLQPAARARALAGRR